MMPAYSVDRWKEKIVRYRRQRFRKAWTKDKDFRPWLREAEDKYKARCAWCRKLITASLTALGRHAKTNKHLLLATKNGQHLPDATSQSNMQSENVQATSSCNVTPMNGAQPTNAQTPSLFNLTPVRGPQSGSTQGPSLYSVTPVSKTSSTNAQAPLLFNLTPVSGSQSKTFQTPLTIFIDFSNIPVELIDKNVAKTHFRQFGRVLRIIIKPRSKACIVEYDCLENAQKALLNGGQYNGRMFSGDWYTIPKKKRVKKDSDPDWDPEVQQELDAMAATGADFMKKSYNLRPEAMVVDAVSAKKVVAKSKKILKRGWKTENTKKSKRSSIKAMSKNLSSWTSEQLELLAVIKQAAATTEEKFKVLDARDKLIRLRSRKELDLKKTEHTVGTCPDMCPEKERMLRDIQHQVALYEQDTTGKGMNPVLAVKQYSRSSADQEVPLPHELRPVSVLQLTMGYLLNCIMHLCDTPDVNLAEWYHFLWDRTRSIRKDITQQELCCQGAVQLLEQCARFHIHCSARLAGEDPSVFDQKINTENLTKCLQTLKYLYNDLRLKGESCSNEAEFRAYVILLNLNDGNFMWEVQQLKLEIQKSAEIKFALEVYSAIDKNNFVKFFKLVHSTGYLNACILLRYFVQVRSRALSTILKCYSPRAPYTHFALSELESLLAFEDADSTVDFVVAHGLYLNAEETHVVLDRKNFQLPEIPYTVERAIKVVESKRSGSVGEVVCRGFLPFPDFQNYTPSNSFDENGLLVISGLLAEIVKDYEKAVMSSPDISMVDQVDAPKGELSHSGAIQQQSKDAEASEEIKNKPHDPSMPFWSIKTDQNAPNVFKGKEESHPQSNTFRIQNIFKQSETDWQVKSDEVAKPQSSIFDNLNSEKSQESMSSIFSTLKPTIFGVESTFSSKSNIFGDQSKTSLFSKVPAAKPAIGGFKFDLDLKMAPSSIFGEASKISARSDEVKEQAPCSFSKSVSQVQLPRSTVCTIKHSLSYSTPAGANQSTHTSSPVTAKLDIQGTAVKKAQVQERERKMKEQKEKEEKLKQELEELRWKEQQRKQQLEKERQLKEKKHLEQLELQKQIEEERKRRMAILEKECKLALEINQTVRALMEDLLVKVEENVKQMRLKKISSKAKQHKMRAFVQKWQQKTADIKKKRQAMDQNPIWMPSRTPREEALELLTSTQSQTLMNSKRYKLGRSIDIAFPLKDKVPLMDIPRVYKALLVRYAKVHRRLKQQLFWKVTVSLPDFREFKVGLSHVEQILTSLFQWKDRFGGTSTVGQYVADSHFSYAVIKKQGVHTFDDTTSGLLFVSCEPNKLLTQRILEGLKSFPKFAQVPVALIFINNSNYENSSLINELKGNKHISNYQLFKCCFTTSAIVETVGEALIFLAQHVAAPPPLELDMLHSFLLDNLVTELWKKVSSYADWNSKYKSCLRLPNLVIDLYNDAVKRLTEVVLDEKCLEYPGFPDEFDKHLLTDVPDVFPCDCRYFPPFWKSNSYRYLLSDTFNILKLPKFEGTWPPTNQKDLKQHIFTYCSHVFENPQVVYFKIMAAILRQADLTADTSAVARVFWSDLIEIIALEKLSEASFTFRHTEFNAKSVFQELFVVYNRKSLDAYCNDEWFYLKHPAVELEIRRSAKRKARAIEQPPARMPLAVEDFDLDQLERPIREENEDDVKRLQIAGELRNLEDSINELDMSMQIHKKICLNFKQYFGQRC